MKNPNCVCKICQIQFYRHPSMIHKEVYCSRNCFQIGRQLGYSSKNKQITQYTCEICGVTGEKQTRKSNKIIRFCSRKCQGKSKQIELAGINSPRFSQVSIVCVICEKPFSIKSSRSKSAKVCSLLCRYKLTSILNSGKGNPSYLHGKANEPYPMEFSKSLKNRIIIRDGESCVSCRLTRIDHKNLWGFDLHVHHIDFDKNNLSDTNLISLCISCHGKTQKPPRKYWIAFYKNLMEKTYK